MALALSASFLICLLIKIRGYGVKGTQKYSRCTARMKFFCVLQS